MALTYSQFFSCVVLSSPLLCQVPHVKIGPEETPRLPYLRFASVTLYPSNEDLSLAIGAILRSFSYPSASLVCAKAECEFIQCVIALQCITCYCMAMSLFTWVWMHRLCSCKRIRLLYVCVKMALWEFLHIHTVGADMTVFRHWTLILTVWP